MASLFFRIFTVPPCHSVRANDKKCHRKHAIYWRAHRMMFRSLQITLKDWKKPACWKGICGHVDANISVENGGC